MKRYKAFISYRREDGKAADLVKNTLVNQYGFSKDEIFLDKHDIGPEAFDMRIESSLKESSSMILIVTPNCFTPKNDDWFINEIKIALSNNISIIPIFFDGVKDLSKEQSVLQKSFTPQEVNILNKSQGVYYDFNFSEQTFYKLTEFINKCHFKKGDFKLIVKEVCGWAFLATILFTLSFLLFIGVGFLWGYLSSSKSEEKVLKDNTTIKGDIAQFKFCGIEAMYNLEIDSIIVNYEYQDELPEKPYDIFIQSMSIPGAVLLLNNNLNYVKYLQYFRGGGKHRQLILLGASAVVCVGSFCGFSQGSQWGRLLKQRTTVLQLQTKLKDRKIWAVVFEEKYFAKLKFDRIMAAKATDAYVWIYPDTSILLAMEQGLKDTSVLLKYNEWEIGKNTYEELIPLIKNTREQEKHIIFKELTKEGNGIIKSVDLPSGIVGVRFIPPCVQSNINMTIEDYEKWKRYKEWISK